MHTYQVCFQRAVVELRDEDFDSKAGRNDSTQSDSCKQCEGNLQKLSLHALGGREDTKFLAGPFVNYHLLGLKFTTAGSDH